ncbi:MAG: PTS sugar transporter subunit IIA [Deltaproteobacteria bacterium]|nr:MAG: PTS sugar transporter subunit IIA [Deltaproteobacteria bacterium]
MVGVIVVTHGQLARELILIAEFIIGKVVGIEAVTTDPKMSVDEIKEVISQAIKKVDKGNGVLILTDMFGGTPSNISLSFLEDKKVEILSGVNLPMLLKVAINQEEKNLSEMAELIKSYGQKNISLASEILQGKKEEG